MNLHKFAGVGAALTTFLTFLGGLSYTFGPVADAFPPEVKKWVTLSSLGATVILQTIHAMSSDSAQPPVPPK